MNNSKRISQKKFEKLPLFGAKLYDRLMHIKPIKLQFKEIAEDLTSRLNKGRLLDVGTGPGRLLLEINQSNKDFELYGLDVSESMIRLAKNNLSSINVDLRQESIHQTSYESNYFDIVVCTGSLYLWDTPHKGIEEIYRILKNGQTAYLYEPYKDIDVEKFSKALKDNLKQVNVFLKLFGSRIMKKIMQTAYRIDEYKEIIESTNFVKSYKIEKIVLGNLPMWVRIQLTKEH